MDAGRAGVEGIALRSDAFALVLRLHNLSVLVLFKSFGQEARVYCSSTREEFWRLEVARGKRPKARLWSDIMALDASNNPVRDEGASPPIFESRQSSLGNQYRKEKSSMHGGGCFS